MSYFSSVVFFIKLDVEKLIKLLKHILCTLYDSSILQCDCGFTHIMVATFVALTYSPIETHITRAAKPITPLTNGEPLLELLTFTFFPSPQ